MCKTDKGKTEKLIKYIKELQEQQYTHEITPTRKNMFLDKSFTQQSEPNVIYPEETFELPTQSYQRKSGQLNPSSGYDS